MKVILTCAACVMLVTGLYPPWGMMVYHGLPSDMRLETYDAGCHYILWPPNEVEAMSQGYRVKLKGEAFVRTGVLVYEWVLEAMAAGVACGLWAVVRSVLTSKSKSPGPPLPVGIMLPDKPAVPDPPVIGQPGINVEHIPEGWQRNGV